MTYFWHILVMINIYGMLAASLNLVVGYTGLLSVCHAAFYGLGSYSATLLMLRAGFGFFPALLFAIIFTGLLGWAVAVPAIRLKGDYFVLATLGFQIIVVTVLYNWVDVTRGPNGIPGIPIPHVFGVEINSVFAYFVFSSVFALVIYEVIRLLVKSPFGRLLRAAREDDLAAAALGKNVPHIKTIAFALGAAMAAVPGGLFAGYLRYIDPTTFTLTEAIFILSIVVIGGTGSLRGPIVGAVFMVLLPEALRFLQLSDAAAANLRQVIYGLLLVVLMRFHPQGLLGEYKFD